MHMALSTRDNEAGAGGPLLSNVALAIIMWIGVAFSAALTALRTFFQYRRNRRFYINDFFILFAMLCHILTAIIYQVAIPPMYELANVGAELITPPPTFIEDADFFLRLQFALDMMLWTTSWSIKFSLLFFFWRLFDSVDSPMRVFWWIMCAITGSTYIVCIILQQFACDPIRDFFTIGACASASDIYHSNLVFQFSVGVDIAVDCLGIIPFYLALIMPARLLSSTPFSISLTAVMLIPFPLLYKLQVSKRQKNILLVIFCCPTIPIIFAILRLVKTNPTSKNVDPIRFQLYSMLENSAAIIAACLPSVRLFFTDSFVSTPSNSQHKYPHTRTHTADTFRRHRGPIPLENVVKAEHTRGSRGISADSREEILGDWQDTRVFVKREFTVTST